MSAVVDFTGVDESPPMSVEEFLALPDNGVHRELIQGRVQGAGNDSQEPDSFADRGHGSPMNLVDWLRQQPEPRGEVVCGEAGFRLKGTKESLVGIDVALVGPDLVARTGEKQLIYDGPPILAVEILSSSDKHEDTVDTVATYLEVGTVVWVVNPDFQTVSVFRQGQPARTFKSTRSFPPIPTCPGFASALLIS